ncbi:hypothetical protein GCM10028808_39590 [Spirosoma migulaei]
MLCNVSVHAQSTWQVVADSSNAYFAKSKFEQAYQWSLKMIQEAEPLHARNPDDTILVTSLVRASISQRLAIKPDTTKGLAHATRALNLLTPRIKQTLLGAKVYSLNAIFNYAVGQREKALAYAELAADRLEKLGITRSSPYWEAQRYRALIHSENKDSLSLTKAVAVIRRLLPVTAQLFGEKDDRYLGLLKLWAGTFRYRSPLTAKHKAEADSVWMAIADVAKMHQDSSKLGTLREAWEYFYTSSNYEKTIALGRRMIAGAEQGYAANPAQDTTLIVSLYSVANQFHQLSTSLDPEAAHYFERAFTLLKPAYEQRFWYTELYSLSSRFLIDRGGYPKALEHAQKAIELCKQTNRTGNLTCIQAQMNLASIYSMNRDKKKLLVAQQILEELIPVINRMDEQPDKMTIKIMALGMLGTVYTLRIPLDDATRQKADALWASLLPLARKMGDSLQLCRMLAGAGEYYFALNKNEEARDAFLESTQIGKKLTNQIYYYIALAGLNNVETDAGNYPLAVRLSEEILAASESNQLPQIRLVTMTNAVDGLRQLGQLERAETLARQAMELALKLYGTRVNYFYAGALGGLGMIYHQRGDISNAIYCFEEGLDLLDQTASPDDVVLTRFRTVMGDIYLSIDKEKALRNYQKARYSTELQPNYRQSPGYISVLQSQMTVLRRLGRYVESVQLADSVIRSQLLTGHTKNTLSIFLEEAFYTYYRVGRQATADSILQVLSQTLVRDTLSTAVRANVLQTIGTAHEFNGRYKEAFLSFSAYMQVAQLLHENRNNITSYVPVRMALCQYNLGNRAEANQLLQGSLSHLRTNVTQNLWYMSENQREAYLEPYVLSEIYGMAFQSPNPTPDELGLAYDYRLLIQGLLLNTSRKVLQATANQADTLLQQRVKTLFTVRKTIAQYSLKPSQYVNIDSLQGLSTQLEKQVGHVAGLIRQETRAYTWQEIRKRLKATEAAVEIIRFNQWAFTNDAHETDTVRYAALVIRPEWPTPHLVLLPNGLAMESIWAIAYAEEIEKPAANRLAYQRYWQPIARELTGVQKVFIATDGIYHLLSLPTLYNKTSNRFLTDELQVVMLGSTRELVNQSKPSISGRSSLFGYPAYKARRNQLRPGQTRKNTPDWLAVSRGGFAFDALPATEMEVRVISQQLTRSHVMSSLNIGTHASEPALKAVVNPRILHIATHGFFQLDTLNPYYKINRLMACGLALAGASDTTSREQPADEDGILTGYEASLLNLGQTELVTLSACQTGIGNAYASEGVFGLQRAFLLAGARSVLMSLWKVNDQLTQQLMADFYRFWLSGMSKPQALRQAQMRLRKQHPEPYYWGAFVLLGQ